MRTTFLWRCNETEQSTSSGIPGEDDIYITPRTAWATLSWAKRPLPGTRRKTGRLPPRKQRQNKSGAKIRNSGLPANSKGFMFVPTWSPDSRNLAWADKDLRLLAGWGGSI